MSNRHPKPETKVPDADPFAAFFDETQLSDGYYTELANLEFTEKIVERMKAQGLKKGELAQRMRVQPGFITRVLSGGNNFELATMVKIARALNCGFRCHLEASGTETLWLDVLKTAPFRRSTKEDWPAQGFKILPAFPKSTIPLHEPVSAVA